MGPNAGMMAPIEAVRRFMTGGDGTGLAQAFAPDGVVILENFPPFLFTGVHAVAEWKEGFSSHARRLGLTGLEAEFGDAQDFALDGGAAFFTLPTRWRGSSHGRPFEESGGWAFVLVRTEGGWRIRSYAWAVTSTS